MWLEFHHSNHIGGWRNTQCIQAIRPQRRNTVHTTPIRGGTHPACIPHQSEEEHTQRAYSTSQAPRAPRIMLAPTIPRDHVAPPSATRVAHSVPEDTTSCYWRNSTIVSTAVLLCGVRSFDSCGWDSIETIHAVLGGYGVKGRVSHCVL